MMSLTSKRELVDTVRPRYCKARRPDKRRLLDDLIANAGCNRKYAICFLNHPWQACKRPKRRGKHRYTLPAKAALITVWRAANCICSKRRVPCMGQQRFPFPMLGLDPDNGSQFINVKLLCYCQQQHITFTLFHLYKKNDHAYLEHLSWRGQGKNWTYETESMVGSYPLIRFAAGNPLTGIYCSGRNP